MIVELQAEVKEIEKKELIQRLVEQKASVKHVVTQFKEKNGNKLNQMEMYYAFNRNFRICNRTL